MTNDLALQRQQVINDCTRKFSLPNNPSTQELLALDVIPDKSSKKLAVLLLTYKREATSRDLAAVSSQSAALIRELRKDGFIFRDDGKGQFLYTNPQGESCRKIVSFKRPKVEVKGKAKALLDKSISACISSIEIYNKPDFNYREESFSILLVNAWELLLKARIVAGGGEINVIKDGQIKKNRAGNPMTIDINKALNLLSSQNLINLCCKDNIQALVEVRDNAIHFINKRPDLSRKVQEFGTASLRNYVIAISEWFGEDLSKYNFYLMPLSFFHPSDIESFSVKSRDKQTQNILNYLRQAEKQHPFEEGDSYNISAQIKLQFVQVFSEPSAFEVRLTDRADAPQVQVSQEDIIKRMYPITYKALLKELRERYLDFKQNNKFHTIMKDLEDKEKNGERYCKVITTDVLGEGKGATKKYYSKKVLPEFDKVYTKK